MALLTLGTVATTSLSAIKYFHGMNVADFAALVAKVLNEESSGRAPLGQNAPTAPSAKPLMPGAITTDGRLFVPNRGVLQIKPGDYIAVDANGWPILLSANAISGGTAPSATTSWAHS
jgi:hypothetical protein